MRNRYAVALAAAAAIAAGGGLVYADTFGQAGQQPAATTEAETTTVTLPTGDELPVTGNGRIRSGLVGDIDYTARILPNGDRVVIPRDAADDVRSGRTDARLFNVSALLRNGYTDAREVPSPADLGGEILDGRAAKASKADTEVTVTFTWMDGKPAGYGSATWTNLDTGETDGVDTENGKATLKLPPGRYGFANMMQPADGSARVYSVNDLDITGENSKYTVDGTKAEPVEYHTDSGKPDEQYYSVGYFNLSDDGEGMVTEMQPTGGRTKNYAIPSAAEPAGHRAGFTLKAELSSA
ncbi:MAG: hypothetical protein ACRD0P_06375, partial [Stackebrandtia sp.]